MTLARRGAPRDPRPGIRHGTAFLVEGLVLLVFLMAAASVFALAFARSQALEEEALVTTRATLLAQEAAEGFCASPADAAGSYEEDGLMVSVSTTAEGRGDGAGTLWRATIVVSDGGAEVYALETARYVAGGGDAS